MFISEKLNNLPMLTKAKKTLGQDLQLVQGHLMGYFTHSQSKGASLKHLRRKTVRQNWFSLKH